MKIVICDDDLLFCDKMKADIIKCFEMLHQEKPQIDVFHSGEELIDSDSQYDMAFLDVEMPGLNGIYVGKKLCKGNKRILIFIITSYNDYLDEALRAHAFRFFQKPVAFNRLLINIRDAVTVYKQMHVKFAINTGEESIIVDVRDIVMVEASSRGTIVYTIHGNYYCKSKMEEVVEKLGNISYFLQTNRSYIVNLKYVSSYGKNYIKIYKDQYTAKLTQNKYNQFKQIYLSLIDF